jgi:hypothetical protein
MIEWDDGGGRERKILNLAAPTRSNTRTIIAAVSLLEPLLFRCLLYCATQCTGPRSGIVRSICTSDPMPTSGKPRRNRLIRRMKVPEDFAVTFTRGAEGCTEGSSGPSSKMPNSSFKIDRVDATRFWKVSIG